MGRITVNAVVDKADHLKLCSKLKLRKKPHPRSFSAWVRFQEAKEAVK